MPVDIGDECLHLSPRTDVGVENCQYNSKKGVTILFCWKVKLSAEMNGNESYSKVVLIAVRELSGPWSTFSKAVWERVHATPCLPLLGSRLLSLPSKPTWLDSWWTARVVLKHTRNATKFSLEMLPHARTSNSWREVITTMTVLEGEVCEHVPSLLRIERFEWSFSCPIYLIELNVKLVSLLEKSYIVRRHVRYNLIQCKRINQSPAAKLLHASI